MNPGELYHTAQQIADAGIIPTIGYVGGRLGWPLLSGLREGRTFSEEFRSPTAQNIGLGLAGAGALLTYLNGAGPEVNNMLLETAGATGIGATAGAGFAGLRAALNTKDGVLEQVARSARVGAINVGAATAAAYVVLSYVNGRI